MAPKNTCAQAPFPTGIRIVPEIHRSAFEFEDNERRDDSREKIREAHVQKGHHAAVRFAFHVHGAGVHAHAVGAPTDDGE